MVGRPLGESESPFCGAVVGARLGWFINHPGLLALHLCGILSSPCSVPPEKEGFLYGKSLSLELCLYYYKTAQPDRDVHVGMESIINVPNLSSSSIKFFLLTEKSAGKHFILEPLKHTKSWGFPFHLCQNLSRDKNQVQYTEKITARAQSIIPFLPALPSPFPHILTQGWAELITHTEPAWLLL